MNGHSETCGCSECYVMRQQRPPAPAAQPAPEVLTFELFNPATTAGQLRDDDGRYATQEQAIGQLNATVKTLGESIDGLRYDLTSALGHLTNNMDGLAADHSTLRRDMATEIGKVQQVCRATSAKAADQDQEIAVLKKNMDTLVRGHADDLSQLTGEIEVLKAAAAAGKARR